MKTGQVVSFGKAWGFIKDDDSEQEYFCFWRDIMADGYKTLNRGDFVEFELIPGDDKRLKAVNVKII